MGCIVKIVKLVCLFCLEYKEYRLLDVRIEYELK